MHYDLKQIKHDVPIVATFTLSVRQLQASVSNFPHVLCSGFRPKPRRVSSCCSRRRRITFDDYNNYTVRQLSLRKRSNAEDKKTGSLHHTWQRLKENYRFPRRGKVWTKSTYNHRRWTRDCRFCVHLITIRKFWPRVMVTASWLCTRDVRAYYRRYVSLNICFYS